MTTLASLKDALQQPFAPEYIQFLPKDIRQENGKSMCLAFPYANKRVYEDRLNELVFGEWSTPSASPYAHENKLIIPATVVILGVAHTDYGEAFLSATSKSGTTREDANTATEAYSQAFRRACAKFLLGRYLYDLPKLKLPYDPKTRQIAISKAERIAWVEKLYLQHGLPARGYAAATTQPSIPPFTKAVQPLVPPVEPATPQPSAPEAVLHQATRLPTSYPNDTFFDWVAQCVNRDAERLEGICTFYGVRDLALLSPQQRTKLTHQLKSQAQSTPKR